MKMGISKEIMLGYVNYKSWAVCFFILYFKNFESKNKNENKGCIILFQPSFIRDATA